MIVYGYRWEKIDFEHCWDLKGWLTSYRDDLPEILGKTTAQELACEYSRFSLFVAAKDVSKRLYSQATQEWKKSTSGWLASLRRVFV